MNNIGITILVVSMIFLLFAIYIKPTPNKHNNFSTNKH
jgi:hypothetical protein